jgi:predicted  nucleic acid-binding Zn-ribbon protein
MQTATKALLSLQDCEFQEETGRSRSRATRDLRTTIQRLRSRLSVQILREYDLRKEHFGAFSVVPVIGEMCSGCHINLSQRTVRLSHYGLTECEHCGRLVYNLGRQRRIRLEVCAA